MTIKNINTKHFIFYKNGRLRYLCIGTCSITTEKISLKKSLITCKNCKRKLKKGDWT